MRAFPVPVQINDEERIMGGIFTLRQTLYLCMGLALGGASFSFTFLPILIRFIFFLLILGVCVVLAFFKIYAMRADQYLVLYLKWRYRVKKHGLKGVQLIG
ncbi:MAG: hypothetical protein VR67_17415 [Peptococcaceae bacterium BRH_c8a]|nr:MAG: hypothetical protein VR67_17415 [Peptococcaceae bacterium BRH_c8a]